MNIREKELEYKNIVSDFSHIKKRKLNREEKERIHNPIFIQTISYKKNFSIRRIVSHIHFSICVLNVIKKNNPDKIYCRIPPNFLVFLLSKLKVDKLVFDIYDLWPESMSFSLKPNFFTKKVFNLWRGLREKHISKADVVIVECDLFKGYVNQIDETKLTTIYPNSFEDKMTKLVLIDPPMIGTLELCYIGTINNIVDLQSIESLLAILKRNTEFQIWI